MNDFVKKMETHIVRNYGQVKNGKINFTWEEFQKALSDFSAALVGEIESEFENLIPRVRHTKIGWGLDGWNEAKQRLKQILSQFK